MERDSFQVFSSFSPRIVILAPKGSFEASNWPQLRVIDREYEGRDSYRVFFLVFSDNMSEGRRKGHLQDRTGCKFAELSGGTETSLRRVVERATE